MSVYALLIMKILYSATFFCNFTTNKVNLSKFYCLQNMSKYEMY